jgi:hypothetical protein
MAIVTVYASQGPDEHILIDLFGILLSFYDASHHLEHGSTVIADEPLASSAVPLSQLFYEQFCRLFHFDFRSSSSAARHSRSELCSALAAL